MRKGSKMLPRNVVFNSRRLKYLMRDSHITIKEMAVMTGMDEATITQFMNGTRRPSEKSVKQLTAVFGRSPSYFLSKKVVQKNEIPTSHGFRWISLITSIKNMTFLEKFGGKQ